MGYIYDIFISYRRNDLTKKWIADHFAPLIKHHVQLELGYEPEIFIDSQLESGTSWPISLGRALGSSRTIIPLWTKMFLESRWCSCEISHMLDREIKYGFRSTANPEGLIFPTILHDGETMPPDLATIQKTEIQDCYSVRMSIDSPKAEILDDKLRLLGKPIANAIKSAPQWDSAWLNQASNSFISKLYLEQQSSQSYPPKFSI